MKVSMRFAAAMVIAVAGGWWIAQPSTSTGAAPRGVGSKPWGVVDLDRVAKSMGWDVAMQSQLETDKKVAEKNLEDVKAQLGKALEERKQKIAETLPAAKREAFMKASQVKDLEPIGLTDAQREEFFRAVQAVQQQFQAVTNQHVQVINNRRALMVNNYRKAVTPIATAVAKSMGLAAVVSPSDNLLYFDADIDITSNVTTEVQRIKPQVEALPPASSQPASLQP